MTTNKFKYLNNDSNRKLSLSHFPFFSKNQYNKEEESFLRELLFISWTDLISSMSLYERKLYPQSIYFLQQCIEKTTKAEFIRNGTSDINISKSKIGHDTYLFELKRIEKLQKDFCKLKGMSFEKFTEGEDTIENLIKRTKKDRHNDSQWILAKKEDILKFIKRFENKRAIEGSKLEIIGSKFFGKNVKKENKLIDFGIELIDLSRIVSSYSELSRYPNEIRNPSSYKELGIVKAYYPIVLKLLRILTIMDGETFIMLRKRNAFDGLLR